MTAVSVDVKQVACIGTGTIGSGWVALFLARGLKVTCWDPAPDFEAKVRQLVDDAWPALTEFGLSDGASPQNLSCCSTLQDAVSAADFIQESAPDREELKVDLLQRITRYAPAATIVASSSSLFRPSVLQAGCAHPERIIIGHPFVPSYLIPLVEIVVAPGAPDEIASRAQAFYSRLGKEVVTLKREYDAYIGNRLQAALVAEAVRLIDEDVCDYEDIDRAVAHGIGVRWAFMGPGLSTHIAGGKGGIKATHAQFGWKGSEKSRLNLLDYIDRRFGDVTMGDLEKWRDKNVLAILEARRSRN